MFLVVEESECGVYGLTVSFLLLCHLDFFHLIMFFIKFRLVCVSCGVDDLFEDDEEEAPVVSNVKNEKEVPKKKYLEEKWKLNSEDQKEFKGFDGSNVDDSVTAEKVPCFALMYKFRKEYVDVSVDAVMADHKGHCAKFKRLLNTELINLGKAKGVVLLWAGFDDDKEDTRAEIMSFLEEDPLITKDYVSNWDLLDLSATSKAEAPPSELPATAE